MKYGKVVRGTFIDRPNRFIAHVEIDGKTETVHVKNTGRCKEIFVPGAEVYLAVADNPLRKTGFDLIGVVKDCGEKNILINIDSQIPNSAAEEWLKNGELFSEKAVIRREVTFGDSRFDFYIEDGERKIFLEVKGVTLENDGIVSFPDAPTQRGAKHLRELVKCIDSGYEAYLLFVIQMKGVKKFVPADRQDPEFGKTLRLAEKSGVNVLAVDCVVTPDSMTIDAPVQVDLTAPLC